MGDRIICPMCGLPMSWYEPWGMLICDSWNYMEGGCKTWDKDEYNFAVVIKRKRLVVTK